MHLLLRHARKVASAIAAAAAVAFVALPASAGTFNLSPITIDTHTLSGSSGYLLFSYGPTTEGTTPVNSTVSVSSPSFSTFSLDNAGASNYNLEPFTFGNTFTFTPTFVSTTTPGADEGNLFTLYALDSSYNPYITSDPTGSNAAVMIVQYGDGLVSSPTTYAPFIPVAPVPEAPTLTAVVALAAASLVSFMVRRRLSA